MCPNIQSSFFSTPGKEKGGAKKKDAGKGKGKKGKKGSKDSSLPKILPVGFNFYQVNRFCCCSL